MTKLCFAAILDVVLAPAAGQEKAPQHLLRLSFADDGPTWFRILQDFTTDVTLNGTPQTHRLRFEVFWKTRIERSGGAAAKVVHTLVRVRGAGRTDGRSSYVYDSATDTTAPAQMSPFADLIGIEISVMVDSQGHVRRRELPQVLQQLDSGSGVKFIRASDMIRPLDLELPELPVAVGARWPGSNASSLAASDEFTFESEYTLLAVSKGKARIGERFVMTAVDEKRDPRDRESNEPGAERALGRRAHRTFTLDLRTGRVVGVEEQTTMESLSPCAFG